MGRAFAAVGMEITVEFTTQLKAALGCGERAIQLDDHATVAAAVDQLASQLDAPTRELLVDGQGALLPSIIVCLNDQQVERASESTLKDGDRLTLLSAISGG